MRSRSLHRHRPYALLALLALGGAHAQEADPPGRVARLSEAQGTVSLEPAGVQEWTAAILNRPLTTGDRLWSDQNSRAELDLGSAVVRLGGSTGLSFFNLDDRTAQMQLTAGTLIVRVRDLQGDQVYEIDTPNLAVTLLGPGAYRVEVDDAGDSTVVKVSEGAAQAEGGGQSVTIGTQQMASFSGVGALTLTSGVLAAPDELDDWSAARDRGADASLSRGYVPEDMPGTQDLDDHGAWQATPDYGYVWAPFIVVSNWAPYRFGHWVWIAPWGWTWIDDAPWGYAPFHYGRWVQWNSTWCWVPGPRLARPVYAPALVAWVRAPDRQRSAGSGPSVAWFPLGPREPFEPAYHASPSYAHNINRGSTTGTAGSTTGVYPQSVPPRRFLNSTPAAVTAVPEGLFTSGQRITGHAVRMGADVLAGATVGAAAPAVVPVRESVLGGAPSRAIRPPPATLLNRPVVARTPPPRAPVPFERQQAAIQANGGRPLAAPELTQLAAPAVAAPVRMLPGASRPLPRPITSSGGGEAARLPATGPAAAAPHGMPYNRATDLPAAAASAAGVPQAAGSTPVHADRPPAGAGPGHVGAPGPTTGVARAPAAPATQAYRAPAAAVPPPRPVAAAPPPPRPTATAPAPQPTVGHSVPDPRGTPPH